MLDENPHPSTACPRGESASACYLNVEAIKTFMVA
jgi:hypothetical protein